MSESNGNGNGADDIARREWQRRQAASMMIGEQLCAAMEELGKVESLDHLIEVYTKIETLRDTTRILCHKFGIEPV
jgi:hypothetical protein